MQLKGIALFTIALNFPKVPSSSGKSFAEKSDQGHDTENSNSTCVVVPCMTDASNASFNGKATHTHYINIRNIVFYITNSLLRSMH